MFTRQKGDVVFRGRKEREAFNTYTAFLQLLELRDLQIEVVRRSLDDDQMPSWARERLKVFGRYAIRRVNPAVVNKTKSYDSWVGLCIKDKYRTRNVLTHSLMMFAAITNPDLASI